MFARFGGALSVTERLGFSLKHCIFVNPCKIRLLKLLV